MAEHAPRLMNAFRKLPPVVEFWHRKPGGRSISFPTFTCAGAATHFDARSAYMPARRPTR
jgi:hypothetical protein